jgi:hypothetical protein
MTMNPAQRRYISRMAVISVAYVAAIFLASSVIPKGAAATPSTIAIALLPGLAVLGFIWALGCYFAELKDEYLRLLEIRKALVATALTLSVASSWGILEIYTDVPRLPVFWAFPIWCAGLGVGALVNRLSLGDAGCA